MERILSGLTWQIRLVYLDDIVVYSKTFTEHIENLETVFARLWEEANLKLNPEKCNLFQKNVCFLGHVISEYGIATDPKKIESVKNWPTPKNLKDLRSFLGLCSYYRRYVFQFSTIAKPLHKLTEKGEKFSWTQECDNAFNRLKHTLINAPILAYPLSEGEFILDTDASGFGISGVLSQLQNNEEKVIVYYSKCLSKAERRYCVTWRELLAIVNSVQQFHHYLYGQHFMVRTDHASLRWLTNFKNPEGQLARWIELSTYDFQIVHTVGRSHSNADALSRRLCENEGCAYCERAETKFKSADNACCARVTYEIDPVSVCKHNPSFCPSRKPLLRVPRRHLFHLVWLLVSDKDQTHGQKSMGMR